MLLKTSPLIFLRNLLQCARCGKNLTASASKGNGGRYYYYHCSSGCSERHQTKEVNKAFASFLSKFQYDSEHVDDIYEHFFSVHSHSLRSIDNDITTNCKRIENAKYLLLDGGLSTTEYKEIKLKCEEVNESLSRRKESLQTSVDYVKPLKFAYNLLRNLTEIYASSSVAKKRLLVRYSLKKSFMKKSNFEPKESTKL